jgi:AcrR family transcriptional regulator
MGRKPIPGLDEKIIEGAIAVGGVNDPNVNFSTRKIAQYVGISEFTLFTHYPDKEILMKATMAYLKGEVDKALYAYSGETGTTFSRFVEQAYVFLLNHPTWTLFLCNYADATSRKTIGKLSFEALYKNGLSHYQILAPFLKANLTDDQKFLAWNSFIRRLLFNTQFVCSGLEANDEKYRHYVILDLSHGLKGLFKEAI